MRRRHPCENYRIEYLIVGTVGLVSVLSLSNFSRLLKTLDWMPIWWKMKELIWCICLVEFHQWLPTKKFYAWSITHYKAKAFLFIEDHLRKMLTVASPDLIEFATVYGSSTMRVFNFFELLSIQDWQIIEMETSTFMGSCWVSLNCIDQSVVKLAGI